MQLVRHPDNPILSANPKNPWEAGSVLNGTVFREDDGLIRMLYRATNDVLPQHKGGYVSSIGYAESRDGIHFTRWPVPLIKPDQPYEEGLGCEDPRITKLNGTYYIYYTAVQGYPPDFNVRIALATTTDFQTVTKHGIVGPRGVESKAACLLAEPIDGSYVWLYTWRSDYPESTIMHAKFRSVDEILRPPAGVIAKTLEHFDSFAVLLPGRRAGSAPLNLRVARGPELGAPPIKTDRGWLMIYCNADTELRPEWQVSAALLDLREPWRVIAATPEPILRPDTAAEIDGLFGRVTFPSGATVIGEDLFVYYGTGDREVGLATCPLQDLLHHLDDHGVDRSVKDFPSPLPLRPS